MAVLRIVPDLHSGTASGGDAFFCGVLGLRKAMDLGFIVTYVAPDAPLAQVSVMRGDPSGFAPAYSVEVDDVDAAHARAVDQGCEIVYPLADEPWGVRRFFVRDPTGRVANILSHAR